MSIISNFKKRVWKHYKNHGRDLPWRHTNIPYHIFISEVMLQQTQVSRVLQKYPEFIKIFPNFNALAIAPLKKVLAVWQGMGYNRRGLYLKQAAEIIHTKYKGQLPHLIEELESLPGIGYATACSVATFAFNKPAIFLETNIRSVFIHHFFTQQTNVSDKEILPLVEKTLDNKNPREWYYALMDYGTMLKKSIGNPSRKSTHHTKQSKFEGSTRQLRGKILSTLIQKPKSLQQILLEYSQNKKVGLVLANLQKEGLIKNRGDLFGIN